jgi:hypothetical protein
VGKKTAIVRNVLKNAVSILVAKMYKICCFGGGGGGPSLHASHVWDARLFWRLYGMVGNQVLKNLQHVIIYVMFTLCKIKTV